MLAGLNYLAIITAALFSMVLGFLWYGPLFSKMWMKELGISESDIDKKCAMKGYMISLVSALLNYITLAAFIFLANINGIIPGLLIGGAAGAFFIAASMASNYAYEGRSVRLFLINAGYRIIYLTCIGALLGFWK